MSVFTSQQQQQQQRTFTAETSEAEVLQLTSITLSPRHAWFTRTLSPCSGARRVPTTERVTGARQATPEVVGDQGEHFTQAVRFIGRP